MNSRFRRQAGFTLIELMIVLTITVVLLSAMVPLLSTSLQAWRNGSSRSELQQTARFAVDSMVRDLRYGSDYEKVSDWEITFTNSAKSPAAYRLNTSTHILYEVTNGSSQPLTGMNVKNSTNVEVYGDYGVSQALFHIPAAESGKEEADRPVEIYLRAIDTVTGQSVTIHTTVQGISRSLR